MSCNKGNPPIPSWDRAYTEGHFQSMNYYSRFSIGNIFAKARWEDVGTPQTENRQKIIQIGVWGIPNSIDWKVPSKIRFVELV